MNYVDNNPYIRKAMEAQELAGQQAQMQNTMAQQANQQAALAEGQQIAQPVPVGSSQPNMGLAMALRKDKKKEEELANREMAQYNQRPAMEYYSKGLNPMDIISD